MTPPNSNENNTPDNPIDLTSDKEDNILTKNPYNISGLTTIPTTESCNRYGNDVMKLEKKGFSFTQDYLLERELRNHGKHNNLILHNTYLDQPAEYSVKKKHMSNFKRLRSPRINFRFF